MATVTIQVSAPAIQSESVLSPAQHERHRKHANVNIYWISFHTSLSGLLYGLDTGSIGPITDMPQFRKSVGEISDLTQGVYVSSILLFAALASVANGYLADRFSRKYTIFAGAVLASAGATLSASVPNLVVLFIARAIYGIGIGLGFSTTTVYLVEIASTNQRGLLGCMTQLLLTFGIAAAYFIAYASYSFPGSIAWRTPFIVQACVALVLAIGLFFIPFSPRWLMQKGREAEVLSTLRKLRNVEVADVNGMMNVNRELAEIRNDIQFDQRVRQSTSYMEIFSRPILRPTLLSLFVMGFQQLTGIDVILYFAPIIFSQAGFPSRQGSFLASGISGIINFVFTIPAQLYVDKVGRRKPLLIGSLIISSALLTLGTLYAVYGQHLPNGTVGLVSGPPKYIAITSIYVLVAAFASTWAIVGRLYTAEIIPNRYRARACAVQQWVNWTVNFVVALTGPYFLSKTACGPYFLYGGLTFSAVIVLAKVMPETKGLRLERIAEVFGVGDEREMMALATGMETSDEGRESRRRAAIERRDSEA